MVIPSWTRQRYAVAAPVSASLDQAVRCCSHAIIGIWPIPATTGEKSRGRFEPTKDSYAMQNYKLNGEIYVVRGAAKCCIYDIEHNKLFSVDKSVADTIEHAVLGHGEPLSQSILAALTTNGIIVPTDAPMSSMPLITDMFKGRKREIEFAWIEVTNVCNLRCRHCYNETDRTCHRAMSFNEFAHVCDELVAYGVSEVQLIGGEPFTIPEKTLFAMLSYAHMRFKSIELFFNGTMVSREQLEWMKENVPKVRIALSLHSFIEEEQDKLTQVPGSYKKITETLRHLKELGMTYRYVGVYTSMIKVGNESDFGVPYKRDYIRLAGRGSLCHYDCKLLKERLKTRESFQFKDLRKTVLEIWSANCFSKYFYIGSNLEVYPCVMERRFSHGNLSGKKLSEIVDQSLLNFSKENVKGCRDCEYRFVCLDCRPDSLSGDKYEKSWFCLYDEQNGVWKDSDARIKELLGTDAAAQ